MPEPDFVGPLLRQGDAETEPADATVPQDWGQVSHVDTPLTPPYPSLDGDEVCDYWFVHRLVLGPLRSGACVPVGSAVLLPYYVGDCVWEITQVQPGMKNRFQLVRALVVKVLRCRDATREEVLGGLPPSWKKVGQDAATCSETPLQRIEARDPSGAPCPKTYWPAPRPLPGSVKEGLEDEKRRTSLPGYPVPWPPEPPPPLGPSLSPPGPAQPPFDPRELDPRFDEHPREHPHDHEETEQERLERMMRDWSRTWRRIERTRRRRRR